jgi:branched-chain amino acid transport system permease protein
VLLQDSVMTITEYWRFVMGTILILLVVFAPRGLGGIAIDLFARLRRTRR